MAGGQQAPLATGEVFSAQKELAAVLAGHDLAEDGFDDRFAAAVGGLAGFGPQLVGYPFLESGVRRKAAAWCGWDLFVVGQAAGGHELFSFAGQLTIRGGLQVGLGAVVGVDQCLLGGDAGVLGADAFPAYPGRPFRVYRGFPSREPVTIRSGRTGDGRPRW